MFRIPVLIAVLAIAVSSAPPPPPEEDDGKAKAAAVGEGDLQYSVYPCDEPVKAFGVSANILWMAAQSKVVTVPLGKGKKTDIQTFQKLDKIPAETATCMVVDNTGTVWIGTAEGLAQRSGAQFVTHSKETGLPDNGITAVCAKAGKVWAGTNAGVAAYDGRAWTAYSTKNGLPGNEVSAILADDAGRVWVGTEKGIGCFDGGVWKVHSMKNGMSWNAVHALGYDARTKTVWAAVGENDVNSYDGKKWKVYMSIQSGITCIMCDTQSRIWFGTQAGLIKFNGEEWITSQERIGIPVSQVNSLVCDTKGDMWFACEQGVLKLLNPYPY